MGQHLSSPDTQTSAPRGQGEGALDGSQSRGVGGRPLSCALTALH